MDRAGAGRRAADALGGANGRRGHESTFYRWIGDPKNKLQRELSEGLKKEESAFKRTLLTTIRSAALARNQYWTAAAWLLERKYPDEFGKADRQRDDAKADAAPKIVLGVVAIANPFAAAATLMIYLGVCLIVDAIWDLVSITVLNAQLKTLRKDASAVLNEVASDDTVVG